MEDQKYQCECKEASKQINKQAKERERESERHHWENSIQNSKFSDCLTHSILIAVFSILEFIYLIFALVNGPHLITIIIIYYGRPALSFVYANFYGKIVCFSLAISIPNITEYKKKNEN